jgi:hypothetical protein
LGKALTIYFLHEITHSSQGIPSHEDVQAMKSVNRTSGNRLLLEFDLRSDYLAANTLSMIETLMQNSSFNYNRKIHSDELYQMWCVVRRGMMYAFPRNRDSKLRKTQVRRIFGHLLMSHILKQKYYHKVPFLLDGELLPDWSSGSDKLSIASNQQPWIIGARVDPISMRKIERLIQSSCFDDAEAEIAVLWRGLPNM